MDTATKATAQAAAGGPRRTRTYYGYSRNGCARCKQQRVRCDESHPECDRCVRVGVKCPGYEQKLRWSAKHEVFCPEQTGPTRQQSRRKQVRKRQAASSGPHASPTPLGHQCPRLEKNQDQQEMQQADGFLQPHSVSSSPGLIQQRPLPSPLTTTTTPASQFTPTTGSSPEPQLFDAVLFDDDRGGGSNNPTWLNLLDQLVPPVSDPPGFGISLNNPIAPAQKPLETSMPPRNVLAPSVERWDSSLPAASAPPASRIASHTSMPLSNDADYVSRDGPFSPPIATVSLSTDSILPQGGGLDMFYPRGLSLKTHVETMRDTDEDASTTLEVNDNFRLIDPVSDSSSEALQIVATSAPARLRTPALPTMSLNDFSTVLVEFYFKVTAQVYSCYDSRMNPFRTAVTQMWGSSRIIYCTLQSMAAASLLRDFPEIAPIGRQLRQEAVELLSKTTSWDINTMFAILMLGGTASWHNSKDLGLPFFNQIGACLTSAPASAFSNAGNYRSYRFFRESMLYWEMLLAFVADNDTISTVPEEDVHPAERRLGPQAIPGQLVPHPWTGFCAETQLAVLKVGRLVRRQRKFHYARRFASMAHISQLRKDMAEAQELEERLVNITHPTEHSVKDTEDRNTPVWHLLTLAEIIRDTGLIQLYHVFPDLLTTRLRQEHDDSAMFGDFSSGGSDVTQEGKTKWLTMYTVRSLEKMKTIPIESGTRDFQPFLLVALCSELRINKPRRIGIDLDKTSSSMGGNLPLHALLNMDMETIEVTRARGFIHSRLTAFLHVLPPKPILVCLDIVKETWIQMDQQAERRNRSQSVINSVEGEADVYWMDVMIENGWETIMA